ncbi:MAG TPA: hypothetical protein DCS97_06060 [Planctomycetes bacterium]|nr:hypothetical protein [Planctomycetota bacterium]
MQTAPCLSVTDAAALVGVSPRHLRRLAAAGVVPASRLGRRGWRRFDRRAVSRIARRLKAGV